MNNGTETQDLYHMRFILQLLSKINSVCYLVVLLTHYVYL